MKTLQRELLNYFVNGVDYTCLESLRLLNKLLLPLPRLSCSASFHSEPLSENSSDSQPSPKSLCCLDSQKRNCLLFDEVIDSEKTVYEQHVSHWLEYQPASLNMPENNKTTPPLDQRHEESKLIRSRTSANTTLTTSVRPGWNSNQPTFYRLGTT